MSVHQGLLDGGNGSIATHGGSVIYERHSVMFGEVDCSTWCMIEHLNAGTGKREGREGKEPLEMTKNKPTIVTMNSTCHSETNEGDIVRATYNCSVKRYDHKSWL